MDGANVGITSGAMEKSAPSTARCTMSFTVTAVTKLIGTPMQTDNGRKDTVLDNEYMKMAQC